MPFGYMIMNAYLAYVSYVMLLCLLVEFLLFRYARLRGMCSTRGGF